MVAIKLETKLTTRINFWIIHRYENGCFSQNGQEFPEILGYIDKLRDLELKVNFTYHLSFPILLSWIIFFLFIFFTIKNVTISHVLLFSFSSFLTASKYLKSPKNDHSKKIHLSKIDTGISLLYNHPWILTYEYITVGKPYILSSNLYLLLTHTLHTHTNYR